MRLRPNQGGTRWPSSHRPPRESCWPTSSSRTMSSALGASTPKCSAAGSAFSGPGGLTYVALSNSWIIINVGGGPTDDKPEVTLETPGDPDRVSSFLNIRVADIQAVYSEWSARGAQFLTPPKQHQYEIRCYIRDPDGHLIEVGQTTDPEGDWTPDHWPSSTSAESPSEFRGVRSELREPAVVPPDCCPGAVASTVTLKEVSIMTTAIIGTGGIGSAIARQLASGGEALQLSSADQQSAQTPGRGDRRSRGRRCRQPKRVAGCRCCHPCAAVFRAEGRHRRDRRRAG